MNKKTPTILNVYGDADGSSYLLGQLSYLTKERQGAFQWSDEALKKGIEWSPLKMPLSSKMWTPEYSDREISGLPGFIHDALPDGWGLLLMDRAFSQAGIPSYSISPLLRLAFLADRTWGALRFDPEWGGDLSKKQQSTLLSLSEQAQKVQQGDTELVSQTLLLAGGSPQGARPKIMVAISSDGHTALVGQEDIPPDYRHVLVKFSAENEPSTLPILEYHYGEAARSLGIRTMPAQVLSVGSRKALCVDRFDRQNGQRQHVHSMAGMLHTTHRIANSDWLQVATILDALPGASKGKEEAFHRAVFNAVFCVRDDHTKNIAFMRYPDHSWGLTPAFDVCHSNGPGGHHTMTYSHHRNEHVTLNDLKRMSEAFGVDSSSVQSVVSKNTAQRQLMLKEAQSDGVQKVVLTSISQRFREIDKALKARSPRKNPTP